LGAPCHFHVVPLMGREDGFGRRHVGVEDGIQRGIASSEVRLHVLASQGQDGEVATDGEKEERLSPRCAYTGAVNGSLPAGARHEKMSGLGTTRPPHVAQRAKMLAGVLVQACVPKTPRPGRGHVSLLNPNLRCDQTQTSSPLLRAHHGGPAPPWSWAPWACCAAGS
jgi:hypothetical protein